MPQYQNQTISTPHRVWDAWAKALNQQALPLSQIPIIAYESFTDNMQLALNLKSCRCVNYFAVPEADATLRVFAFVADDVTQAIYALSYRTTVGAKLPALTPAIPALHVYEREMAENFGIAFEHHPWLKPIRFPWNAYNPNITPADYPFYEVKGGEVHLVGVGPIHAGVIKPGHFRFICHGEHVLHLEIQLGYQHRGIEHLLVTKPHLLHKIVTAECISGDSCVADAMAFVGGLEALSGHKPSLQLSAERTIALELERVAMHVADLSALCTDVAYQLGSAVFGALRTPLINFFQSWCGNRFGRSLIRPAGSHFPLHSALRAELRQLIAHFTPQYTQMAERTFSLPSVLSRFEGIGKVTTKQAESIGAVGMAARTCGLQLDARASHPFAFYAHLRFQPQVQHSGDVYARAMLRHEEVLASLELILAILDALDEMPQETIPTPNLQLNVAADSVVVSIVEGWRGEIVHTLFTDANGNIRFCKVKDPSLHNWFALALAVRNAEISDFPICNKSFNLSYCGNDL